MDRLLRARVLLSEAATLGLTLEDLVAASQGTSTSSARPLVPTVREYVERIAPSFTKGTLRTYRSYWRLAVEMIGDKPLDLVSVDDCEAIGSRPPAARSSAAPEPTPGLHGRTASQRCGPCSSGPGEPG